MAKTTYLTLDKKGRTTVPEEVREALGVGAGDFVLLERTDHGTFELVPASLVPKDQLWFYHPEMQQRVQEAEAYIRSKRSRRAGGAEFLRQLDSWSAAKPARRRRR